MPCASPSRGKRDRINANPFEMRQIWCVSHAEVRGGENSGRQSLAGLRKTPFCARAEFFLEGGRGGYFEDLLKGLFSGGSTAGRLIVWRFPGGPGACWEKPRREARVSSRGGRARKLFCDFQGGGGCSCKVHRSPWGRKGRSFRTRVSAVTKT